MVCVDTLALTPKSAATISRCAMCVARQSPSLRSSTVSRPLAMAAVVFTRSPA